MADISGIRPAPHGPTARDDVTGLVLAGGRGSRMAGADKGLQMHHSGLPMAQMALARLAPQVGPLLLNANRNLDTYRTWGVAVCSDDLPDYPGPLAGFLAGMRACTTPWMVTVPCDTPNFPSDLVARLGEAALAADADIAMAGSRAPEGRVQPQPVFCLMKVTLHDSLRNHIRQGEASIARWVVQQRHTQVVFDQADAFFNINTLADLHQHR